MHFSLVHIRYFSILCNILIINYIYNIYMNIYKNGGRMDMQKT